MRLMSTTSFNKWYYRRFLILGFDLYYKNNQLSNYSNQTDWTPLDCTLLMDENFENYLFLAKWMRSFIDDDDWRNLIKDIKLHILSANKKILLTYTFVGSFPVSLGSVTFDSGSVDPTQIQFNVSFRYQFFTWEKETF